MTADPPAFPGWNWEDPDGLAERFGELTASFAECGTLERVPTGLPYGRADFERLGPPDRGRRIRGTPWTAT